MLVLKSRYYFITLEQWLCMNVAFLPWPVYIWELNSLSNFFVPKKKKRKVKYFIFLLESESSHVQMNHQIHIYFCSV